MRYVLAVAETNNFTQAPKRCLVVQSALSPRSHAWNVNWARSSSSAPAGVSG